MALNSKTIEMKGIIYISLLAALVFSSCKKASDRKCFKSAGTETTREIVFAEDFDRMMLHPHIAYELIQDSTDKVVIRGGENLVNFIECKIVDGRLEIKNTNKCAFLRAGKKNKNKIVVEIHFTTLINMHYEGSEYLKSIGTIHSDYFALLIRDGAGPLELTMDSKVIEADVSHGWGSYTLHGTTETARIGVRSNGFCDVSDLLITDSVYVASDTPGHVRLKANGIPLAGYIKGSGNVYYSGTPVSNTVIISGTGQLIQQ